MQHNALQRNATQCTAAQCNATQRNATQPNARPPSLVSIYLRCTLSYPSRCCLGAPAPLPTSRLGGMANSIATSVPARVPARHAIRMTCHPNAVQMPCKGRANATQMPYHTMPCHLIQSIKSKEHARTCHETFPRAHILAHLTR